MWNRVWNQSVQISDDNAREERVASPPSFVLALWKRQYRTCGGRNIDCVRRQYNMTCISVFPPCLSLIVSKSDWIAILSHPIRYVLQFLSDVRLVRAYRRAINYLSDMPQYWLSTPTGFPSLKDKVWILRCLYGCYLWYIYFTRSSHWTVQYNVCSSHQTVIWSASCTVTAVLITYSRKRDRSKMM